MKSSFVGVDVDVAVVVATMAGTKDGRRRLVLPSRAPLEGDLGDGGRSGWLGNSTRPAAGFLLAMAGGGREKQASWPTGCCLS